MAAILREDESYPWPESVNGPPLAGAEAVATHPCRNDVPRHLRTQLLRGAERDIDPLALAGLSLTEEHPDRLPTLTAKAEDGARIRPLLADPEGRRLAARDQEYRIGGGAAERVAAVPAYYDQHLPDSAQVRLHNIPLYTSIHRFDDEMLVNVHA